MTYIYYGFWLFFLITLIVLWILWSMYVPEFRLYQSQHRVVFNADIPLHIVLSGHTRDKYLTLRSDEQKVVKEFIQLQETQMTTTTYTAENVPVYEWSKALAKVLCKDTNMKKWSTYKVEIHAGERVGIFQRGSGLVAPQKVM